LATVTWFNNERKEASVSESATNAASVPADLGNYDTKMANDNLGQNKNAPVDYYMLALSWSPSFCEMQRNKNNGEVPKHLAFQCNQAAQLGWVIHGLWPQAAMLVQHPITHDSVKETYRNCLKI